MMMVYFFSPAPPPTSDHLLAETFVLVWNCAVRNVGAVVVTTSVGLLWRYTKPTIRAAPYHAKITGAAIAAVVFVLYFAAYSDMLCSGGRATQRLMAASVLCNDTTRWVADTTSCIASLFLGPICIIIGASPSLPKELGLQISGLFAVVIAMITELVALRTLAHLVTKPGLSLFPAKPLSPTLTLTLTLPPLP